MSPGTRGSEWITFQRCMAILQRLQRGPASAEELIQAVLEIAGTEAYPPGEVARKAAFKHDREKLRNVLKANFFYDPAESVYTLQDPGPFGYLQLSGEALAAVRTLSEAFAGEVGKQARVRALLDELLNRLPPGDRRRLENQLSSLDLDLQQEVDSEPLSQTVWEKVNRAVSQHRKLAFNYLSPRQEDRLARYHEVAPYKLRYREGHWYLYADDLLMRNPHGVEWRESGYKNFRLHYIQDDERLEVLPGILSGVQRRPPRLLVHYRLAPELGRGMISRHFEDMEIERLADGSAEVRGYTDDVWEAARRLLGYGEGCVVLGGEELRREMENRVQQMARNYGLV
jgi:predicted DNA-binding transcriptional regulator YafY